MWDEQLEEQQGVYWRGLFAPRQVLVILSGRALGVTVQEAGRLRASSFKGLGVAKIG